MGFKVFVGLKRNQYQPDNITFFNAYGSKLLEKSVALAQPQQPPFLASGSSSLVFSSPMTSSATVGWMPTHELSYSLVTPHFMAMPTP